MAVNNYALNNVERFKFWCQKVLPLVYDDSLSYYEVLCKVVTKVNEVIDNENAQNELLNELNSEVGSLAQAQSEQYEELSRAISQGADAILALQTAVAGKVDKAQSASDNGKVLGIVGGQVTPVPQKSDEIFYANYNVTPFSEIYSAWDDDILVVVSRVNQLGNYEHAVLSDISTTKATFIIPASPSDGSYEKITCDANGWDVETVQYSEGGVFYAEYEVTPFADIEEAISQGKIVLLNLGNASEMTLATLQLYNEGINATFVYAGPYSVSDFNISSDDTWTHATYNYSENDIYEVDIVNPSFSDIESAYQLGKLCIVKLSDYVIPLTFIDDTVAIFALTGCDPDPHIGQLYVHSDDTVTTDDTELMPANVGAVNAGKVLVADSNGDLQPVSNFEVFPVTYGTTTFLEIFNAVSAMKLPVMIYQNDCYVICSLDGSMGADFVCSKAGVIQQCNCGTDDTWSYASSAYVPTAQGVANAGKTMNVNASGNVVASEGLPYRVTAPSAANTNGNIIPVVLGESNDPQTKYDGYLYIIHEESAQ